MKTAGYYQKVTMDTLRVKTTARAAAHEEYAKKLRNHLSPIKILKMCVLCVCMCACMEAILSFIYQQIFYSNENKKIKCILSHISDI